MSKGCQRKPKVTMKYDPIAKTEEYPARTNSNHPGCTTLYAGAIKSHL